MLWLFVGVLTALAIVILWIKIRINKGRSVHWTRLFAKHESYVVAKSEIFSRIQQEAFIEWVADLPFNRGEALLGSYEKHHFSTLFHTASNLDVNEKDEGRLKSVSKLSRRYQIGGEGESDDATETRGEQHHLTKLREFVDPLARLVGGLIFNDIWVQRYREGSFLNPHRDPPSFKGCVIIALFGDFEGGELQVEDEILQVRGGDVIFLRGYNAHPKYREHALMPLHRVYPVKSGTRYSLVLNAIE